MFERIFKSRFFKASRQEEMEEVTDQLLLSYIKNQEDTYDRFEIRSSAHHLDAKIDEVWENVELYMPGFMRILSAVKRLDDEACVQETGAVLPYIKTLREIVERYRKEDDFDL